MNKCKDCSERKACSDSVWSWIFLFIGILAAIAMRVVVLFMHVNPAYAKAAWYTGVGLFFLFFVYRYNVSRSRAAVISKQNLMQKIHGNEPLKEEDRKVIGNILCSLISRKERINFMVIFVLSAIALTIAIIADMIK